MLNKVDVMAYTTFSDAKKDLDYIKMLWLDFKKQIILGVSKLTCLF